MSVMNLYLTEFEGMFNSIFYIVIDFIYIRKLYLLYSVIFKDSSGYIYKNVLCIMKFISLRTFYLLQALTKY